MRSIGETFLIALTGSPSVGTAAGGTLNTLFGQVSDTLGSVVDIDTLFGTADLPDPSGAASEMGTLLASWIPDDIRALLVGASRGTPPPPARRTGPPIPTPPDTAALSRLLDRLRGPDGSPDAATALTSIAGLPTGVLAVLPGNLPPPGSRWDVERVARAIRDFIVTWLNRLQSLGLPGENTKRVLKEIDTEALGPLQLRLTVAGALSLGAIINTSIPDLKDLIGIPSNRDVGNEVHERLQKDYRERRPSHLIVQESYAYTGASREALATARKHDDTLLALFYARDAVLIQVRKAIRDPGVDASLRDDIIDFGDATVGGRSWEIKPVRSAAFGVIQEFAYRSLFNMWVALLQDLPTLHKWLRSPNPKPILFVCEHAEPGRRQDWPEAFGKVFTVSKEAGRSARTILTFTVDPLPGLLLYVRYNIPAWLILSAARQIARDLDRASKDIKADAKPVIAWAAVIAAACVIVLLVIAAVYYAVVAVASAALTELVTALGAALAALGAQLPRLIEAIRRVTDAVAPLVSEFGLTVSTARSPATGQLRLAFRMRDGSPVPVAGADVGPLRLEDCPLVLLARTDDVMEIASAVALALLLSSTRAATPRSPDNTV